MLLNILIITFFLLILNIYLITLKKINITPQNYKFHFNNFRNDYTLDITCTLPFVSSSCFILYSDYVYDDFVKNVDRVDKLKNGDVIFVRTEFLNEFFKSVFPKINTKFILITHYSDYSTDKRHLVYLSNPKLIRWFGQNPGFQSTKFEPLPIGFEGTVWNPWQNKIKFLRNLNLKKLKPWQKRKYLIYANFNSASNPKSRQHLKNFIKSFPNVLLTENRISYRNYMKNIENSKYVICPRGNGLDTHRFYETVLMGSIPIVENSTLLNLYLKTTSLILNDFKELTIDSLTNPSKHIKNFNFSKDILYFDTWFKHIEIIKKDYYK